MLCSCLELWFACSYCRGRRVAVAPCRYFSYRWTDIFEQGDFVKESMKAVLS